MQGLALRFNDEAGLVRVFGVEHRQIARLEQETAARAGAVNRLVVAVGVVFARRAVGKEGLAHPFAPVKDEVDVDIVAVRFPDARVGLGGWVVEDVDVKVVAVYRILFVRPGCQVFAGKPAADFFRGG